MSVGCDRTAFIRPSNFLGGRGSGADPGYRPVHRSGRQGDPGTSLFYISLQDELMRLFGGNQIDGMLKKLGLKENESIDHPWINKAIERAQKKVETRNFDIRKTLIKFDDVMNDQRQVIFSQRLKILKSRDIEEILEDFPKKII